jgi:hypothetical protein
MNETDKELIRHMGRMISYTRQKKEFGDWWAAKLAEGDSELNDERFKHIAALAYEAGWFASGVFHVEQSKEI